MGEAAMSAPEAVRLCPREPTAEIVAKLTGYAHALDHARSMAIKPTKPSEVETVQITAREAEIMRAGFQDAATALTSYAAERDEMAEVLAELMTIIDWGVSVNISDAEMREAHPEDRRFIKRTRKALDAARALLAKLRPTEGEGA